MLFEPLQVRDVSSSLGSLPIIFVWNDSYVEKNLVAASACSDSLDIYYALESKCARAGGSCSASSQAWYGEQVRHWIAEHLSLAD